METLLQNLEKLENIMTLTAIMITLCFIFLAWHILMSWLNYKEKESEKYEESNLEFLDRRIKNELDYTRRLFTDNACEISKLKNEIQELRKKENKKK